MKIQTRLVLYKSLCLLLVLAALYCVWFPLKKSWQRCTLALRLGDISRVFSGRHYNYRDFPVDREDRWLFHLYRAEIPDIKRYPPEQRRAIAIQLLKSRNRYRYSTRSSPEKQLELLAEYSVLDPDNGWYDLARAEIMCMNAYKTSYGAIGEVTNPKKVAKAMQYLKAAFDKDFCSDRADELHQIKLQMFADMPVYERRQYQQMIRSHVRRRYLDLLDVIPAYVDYLIQQKKVQHAREILALYLPLMLVWCGNSYNYSQLDSFMMNAPRRLEMIGQLYDKAGLPRQSREIADSVIPRLTELRRQWQNGLPEQQHIKELLRLHAEDKDVLYNYYLPEITAEQLTPSRMARYSFFDLALAAFLMLALATYALDSLYDLHSHCSKAAKHGIQIPGPPSYLKLLIGCVVSILPPLLLWGLVCGWLGISGREYNLQFNLVGTIFQTALVCWAGAAMPLLAVRFIAVSECRKINEEVPPFDKKLFVLAYFGAGVWMLIGLLFPVIIPASREWLPVSLGSREFWALGIICWGVVICSTVIAALPTEGNTGYMYKKYMAYRFYLISSMIPIAAVAAIFFSLVVMPRAFQRQDDFFRQDQLFGSDKVFFNTVPETESVIKKRKEIMDYLKKLTKDK